MQKHYVQGAQRGKRSVLQQSVLQKDRRAVGGDPFISALQNAVILWYDLTELVISLGHAVRFRSGNTNLRRQKRQRRKHESR